MNDSVKKTIYISAFIVLGILLALTFHFISEIVVINLLIQDFERYNLGFTWDTWYRLHFVFASLLIALGIIFGLEQGKYWWQYIYVDKKLKKNLQDK